MFVYAFIGIILGAGLVLPGVSGGVIAVVLGIYEKMIYAFNNFFKSKKENFLFLLPIGIGTVIGLILFGNVLKFLFDEFYVQSCFSFMGLILGGVPFLFKKATNDKPIKKKYFIGALLISLTLFVLGNNKFNFYTSLDRSFCSILKLILTGFIFVSGKVIPGISSSFMLMIIGMYEYYLYIISNPINALFTEIYNIIPIILGVILGFVILIKIVSVALEKYNNISYTIITGFVIGSLPAIYPGLEFNFTGLISLVLFMSCYFISYKTSTISNEN